MKLNNVLLSLLAGGGLAVGGGLAYRKRRKRLEKLRFERERMKRIISLALNTLVVHGGGRSVPASEAFFFIWVVERVAHRQDIGFPSFNFTVKKGMLTSGKLTYILRRMLDEGRVRLEANDLVPLPHQPDVEGDEFEPSPRVIMVIEETAAQWDEEFPDEQLVRFGKLFR